MYIVFTVTNIFSCLIITNDINEIFLRSIINKHNQGYFHVGGKNLHKEQIITYGLSSKKTINSAIMHVHWSDSIDTSICF